MDKLMLGIVCIVGFNQLFSILVNKTDVDNFVLNIIFVVIFLYLGSALLNSYFKGLNKKQ